MEQRERTPILWVRLFFTYNYIIISTKIKDFCFIISDRTCNQLLSNYNYINYIRKLHQIGIIILIITTIRYLINDCYFCIFFSPIFDTSSLSPLVTNLRILPYTPIKSRSRSERFKENFKKRTVYSNHHKSFTTIYSLQCNLCFMDGKI